MKKIFLTLMALVAVMAVNAQIYGYSSTSVKSDKIQSDGNTTWFVRAGLNIMSADFDGEDSDNAFGYDINVGFQKPFTDLGFYWGMEMGLFSRGYTLEDSYDGCDESTYIGHSLSFSPVTLGFKYDINVLGGITLDAHAGAFISYTYGESSECDCGDIDEDEWFGGGDCLDYGCKVGIGAWWKNKYNLDFSYQRGFNDSWFEEDGHFSSFTVSLGYAF